VQQADQQQQQQRILPEYMTREMLQQYGLLDRISSRLQPPPAKRLHVAAAAAAAAAADRSAAVSGTAAAAAAAAAVDESTAMQQDDEHEFVYDMYVPVFEDEEMTAVAAADEGAGQPAPGFGHHRDMPVVQVGDGKIAQQGCCTVLGDACLHED
jgi:hypothetical protein